VSDFDLLASSLRADAGDLRAFVEALATKLEGAFGERTRVERSGFLGGKRVRRIAVRLGEDEFALDHAEGRVECRRRTVVRGIALKNEDLPLDAWIDDLSRGLVAEASETERGRAALQRMLEA
jgi:hypothetical protein